MKTQILAPVVAIALLASSTADAHHAFNMYDATTLSLTGTVKTWVWKNPHAMMDLVATMPDGSTQQWQIELSAPNIIGRRGWNKDSIKVGDKLPVTIHPMKDGSKYGLLMTATRPDGQVLKDKA
ncbi:MAG: hypothetical protein EON96_02430 [Caulobacteraceae bacterium]|nr:MAG: hypothetical protein EON96_02430 [Caulobacteraceae bacterium]